MKPEAGLLFVILCPELPRDTQVKVTLFARPLLNQLHEICARANMMYSRVERVLILEHYIPSKTFTPVREVLRILFRIRNCGIRHYTDWE
jgi:hypothetical protein